MTDPNEDPNTNQPEENNLNPEENENPEGENLEKPDQYFDDDEDDFLTADHPLMSRFQKALAKQLTEEHERVDLQLKEKEMEVKNRKQKREEVGVNLYGVQHSLAKMQMQYERTQDNYNIVQRYRTEAESTRDNVQKQFDTKKQEQADLINKVKKSQDEFNQLNRTVRQVDEYNEQMKSEIAITKRGTYKAEENAGNLEKNKKKQDLLIDNMNEEIKKLTEQKSLLHAQLLSQKEETLAARDTLKEASIEIENIKNQKNMLLEDWQNSLLGMQRRDKALQALKNLVTSYNNQIVELDSELNGIQQELNKEHIKTEELTSKNERLQNLQRAVKDRIDRHKLNENKIKEEMDILKNSIQLTEKEKQSMEIERLNIEEQMGIMEKSIMKIHTDLKGLMESIINRISEQTTIEKSSTNLAKQTKQTYSNIFDKENEIQGTENEIARIKIDILNTQLANTNLSEKLKELTKELSDRTEEEGKKEKEIKDNIENIQKKQQQVDKINKELGKYSSQNKDLNTGPLDAQINNLSKNVEAKEKECASSRIKWMKDETQLLSDQKEYQSMGTKLQMSKDQKLILEQKKLRMQSNSDIQLKEIRIIEVNLKNLRYEMNKLNLLLSKHRNSQNKLVHENYNVESEFVQKLKDLENESLKLETRIQELKDEKAELLSEIVEAERQIYLWDRKIQLEKKMMETLDQTIGQKEINEMRKEIHNMELRFQQLKRKQEELIKDIERAVSKRNGITIKYQPKEEKVPKRKNGEGNVSRKIETLKTTLKNTTESSMQFDQAISKKGQELENISQEINIIADEAKKIENEAQSSQLDIIMKRTEKAKNQALLNIFQNKSLKYEMCLNNSYKPPENVEILTKNLEDEQNKLQNLIKCLDELSRECPELIDVIKIASSW